MSMSSSSTTQKSLTFDSRKPIGELQFDSGITRLVQLVATNIRDTIQFSQNYAQSIVPRRRLNLCELPMYISSHVVTHKVIEVL